jgi:hypothetical protein
MAQKRIIRKAVPADFPEIYKLQDSPRRDLAFNTPLPPYDSYVKSLIEKIESGNEIYYVMEADSKVISFLSQGIYIREKDMIVAVNNVYELTHEEFKGVIPFATEQSLDMIIDGGAEYHRFPNVVLS